MHLGSKLTGSHGRYHPLWKLISQACFGVYLLASGLAKSEVEVVRIMQSYVDEFDGFLERTTDDFHLIQVDVQTRIDYLRVPLRHVEVFDEMLMDLDFRASIVEYNKKIEFAIGRFTTAVNDSLKDMHKGKEAIGALWHYLRQVTQECSPDATNLVAVYHAMIGNVEAWNFALSKLYKRGNVLIMALSHLGAAVVEMQRRVQLAVGKDKVSGQVIFTHEWYGTICRRSELTVRAVGFGQVAQSETTNKIYQGTDILSTLGRFGSECHRLGRSRSRAGRGRSRSADVQEHTGRKTQPQKHVQPPGRQAVGLS